MTDIPAIALEQFTRRRAWLAREVRERRLASAEADQRLAPWAALALRAGAELSQIGTEAFATVEDYRKAGLTDREARACTAEDLCPLAECRRQLAIARDAAIDITLSKTERTPQARALMRLADHFHCAPYHCATLKEAA